MSVINRRRDRLILRARRAAAYAKTPVTWTPSIPTVLTALFLVEALAVIAFPQIRVNRAALILIGLSIPLGFWLFIYWKIYLSVFTTPYREPVPLTDSRWKIFDFLGWGEERMQAFILLADEPSKDLVLYLHGYPSSLARGESR
ncbi:MAG TPA: hypothetical protein EYO98_00460, partial [Candidatus Poseidoniales archaeon]|nr:hypothetical protein [Candidatus Poseidoniales archaeon]